MESFFLKSSNYDFIPLLDFSFFSQVHAIITHAASLNKQLTSQIIKVCEMRS